MLAIIKMTFICQGAGKEVKKIDVSKDDILKMGLELLTKGSAKSLTLRDLSSQTGVSVGTLYNYFGDKEQLQREIFGYFWKTAMCQENESSIENMDFITHVEQSYKRFFDHFQKLHGVICGEKANDTDKCNMQENFPVKHVSAKLEIWVQNLVELHADELIEKEKICTRKELVDYIVAVFIGNFVRGNDNLGIAMKTLQKYL